MGKRDEIEEIIVQFLLSLLATFVCAIPTLLFLGAQSFLSPEGFFQNFLILGIGVWFLRGIQIILFIVWIVALLFIWN